VIDASALQLLAMVLTSWLERRDREALAYLIEENRLLRQQLGGRRLQLTDGDWRRLAVRAFQVGRLTLNETATIVTPDAPLRCHRQLSSAISSAPAWTAVTPRTPVGIRGEDLYSANTPSGLSLTRNSSRP
jgi:hypothetical protein